MVELRHLRYFVAVAEELHFGRAATRLGVSQPPLSKQISDLERELDTALFTRTSRVVKLTNAGEAFLLDARAVLASAERAADEARRVAHGATGRLRIGVRGIAATRYLSHAVRLYTESNPSVELHFEDLPTDPSVQAHALLERRIDVAIVRLHPNSAEITSDLIAVEPHVAVLPAQHRLAEHDRVSLEELLREPYIGGDPAADEASKAFWDQIGVLPTARLHANLGPMTLLGLVSAGLGVAMLPKSIAAWNRDDIVYRAIEPPPQTPIRVAWRTDDLGETGRRFIEILRATTGTVGQ